MRKEVRDLEKNVITTGAYMDQLYYSEDGYLRDGGLWPEYAYTMLICVDSYRDGMALGRIHNYFFEEEVRFRTLDQLLFGLEDILNRAGAVQRDAVLRREINEPGKRPAKRKRGGTGTEEDLRSDAVIQQPPFYPYHGLLVKRGAAANFHIRVISRFHCSMQGVLSRSYRGKTLTAAFRSEMELLTLIRKQLEAAETED